MKQPHGTRLGRDIGLPRPSKTHIRPDSPRLRILSPSPSESAPSGAMENGGYMNLELVPHPYETAREDPKERAASPAGGRAESRDKGRDDGTSCVGRDESESMALTSA